MTEGVAESWARLRLVQGDSSEEARELGTTAELVTVTVGSEPESSWVVKEEGVKPLHFSLHWDGSTLRIADTHGAGDVRVDGQLATAQWRSVSGRVRIEFGKAAIVAETSVAPAGEAQPSPSPLPPIAAGSSEAPAASRVHKATLIGVSPLGGVTAQVVSVRSDTAGAPEVQPSGDRGSSPPGGFSTARPADLDRQRKHTLLGMAVNIPELLANTPPAPSSSEPAKKEADGQSGSKSEKASTPSSAEAGPAKKGVMSGTLIGVANPVDMLRGVQRFAPAGQDVALVDHSSAREAESKLAAPRSDAAALGAVTQNEVRAVSPEEASGGSIGTAWQEVPSPGTPQAVLINTGDDIDPSMRIPAYERRADASQQAAAIDAPEEKRAFPWRYVGIGLLTAAAYFAWLYLLDHL